MASRGNCKFTEQSPYNSAHQQERNEDRDQRNADEQTVKPISCAPFRVAANGSIPASRWRVMFFHDYDASFPTKPWNGQSHKRKIVQTIAAQIHDSTCADQRYGDGYGGDQVARPFRQENEDNYDDQMMEK